MTRYQLNPFLRTVLFGVELPTGELRDEILKELFNRLTSVGKPLSIITAFNAICMSVAYYAPEKKVMIAVWLIPLLWFSFSQYKASQKATDRRSARVPKASFINKASRNCLIFGFWWGLSTFIFVGPNESMNVLLVGVATGMCAAAAASSGGIVGMTTGFSAGCIPLTILAAFYYGSQAGYVTLVLGSTLVVIMIYMSYLKYLDTVERHSARLKLRQSYDLMRASLSTAGTGVQIKSQDGEIVFENKMYYNVLGNPNAMTERQNDLLTLGTKTYRERVDVSEQGHKISVLEDVTTFVRQRKDLLQAHREVEESADAKSRFVSAIGSDLKIPLATISSIAELIGPDSNIVFSEGELKDYAQEVLNSCQSLTELVDSVIDYASLQDGEGIQHTPPRPIQDVAATSIQTALVMAGKRHRSDDIEAQINTAKISHAAQGAIVGRILSNILANAVTYSHDGSKVLLKVDIDEDGQTVIVIRDHGVGIPGHILRKAKEPFFQSDASDIVVRRGNGLGLSLTDTLVKQLGGEMTIDSKINQWTNVTIRLPNATYFRQSSAQPQEFLAKAAG